MVESMFKVAILIISDTAYKDPSTDKAGAILTDAFASEGGDQWKVEERVIVRDDVLDIQRETSRWCDGDGYMNLVITTGGTGFTHKDVTPEAISPLLHKQAHGLVHGMLAASLEITPFAVMSRPVAGIRNRSLIITLPGSPKGAKENLLAVLKLLPHACMQAAGKNSRDLHAGGVKKLERDAGLSGARGDVNHPHHGHDHSHNHNDHKVPKAHTKVEDRPMSNDLRQAPTNRYRESPYELRSVDEALELILSNTPMPKPLRRTVDSDLTGYVLAEDVKANEAVPAFRASIVDGYAVIVEDEGSSLKGIFPVTSVSHASPGGIEPLKRGQIARITTGAPLPPGATSVVMVEDTVLRSTTEDGKEEREVEILTDQIKKNENVREVGSDVKMGDTILKKNKEISATGGELGLLASVGRSEVLVNQKPVIGVLSTGDEIIEHNRPGPLRLGEVRDTNRPTLMSAARRSGYEVVDLGIARDKPGEIEQRIRDGMRKADVIITTGGVSMGELDLLKPTIERSLGGTIHFGRVSMKPGKPTTFATIPYKNNSGDPETRPIFSLPGNPASAIVTFHLFVLPSLHYSSGIRPGGLPKALVTLNHDIRPDPQRPEYHRVVVTSGNDGLLRATSTGGQRSSRVGSLESANGLLCLPAQKEIIEKGQKVQALLMGNLPSYSP
ncbi:MAG: hypothetical protein Q9167_004253 [Letrouitia subvulpina]